MPPISKSQHCAHLFLAELIRQNSKDLNVPKRQSDLFLLTTPSTVQQRDPNFPRKNVSRPQTDSVTQIKPRSHLNFFDLKPTKSSKHVNPYFITSITIFCHPRKYLQGMRKLVKTSRPGETGMKIEKDTRTRTHTHGNSDFSRQRRGE